MHLLSVCILDILHISGDVSDINRKLDRCSRRFENKILYAKKQPPELIPRERASWSLSLSGVTALPDGSPKRPQLLLGKVAVGAGFEHSQLHAADGGAAQSADFQSHSGAHAADLAVPSLLDDKAEHRPVLSLRDYLHRAGERLDSVVQLHSGHQPGQLILVHRAVDSNAVGLGDVL